MVKKLFIYYLFTILIGPEVADAWSVGHLIGINIRDINVISNLTYCSDKKIHSTEIAHQILGNSKVKATFVKPKRAFYVRHSTACVSLNEKIV